ncbi:MAG: hypothetical protein JNK72_19660 [Myxococcales bacterium]|nr:hypothetical protein [Myxococcales bacterium]
MISALVTACSAAGSGNYGQGGNEPTDAGNAARDVGPGRDAGQKNPGIDAGTPSTPGDAGFTTLADGNRVPNPPVDAGTPSTSTDAGFTTLADGNRVPNPPVDAGTPSTPTDAGFVTLSDGAMVPADAGPGATGDGGSTGPRCGAAEVCGNGIDDNCNDRVDENCPCIPGTSQRCYPGDPSQAGRGVCVFGQSRCEGTGEFGMWGACEGFGVPRPVTCGMGLDFRCNGIIDEGCECRPGATRPCYTGPMGTAGIGACRAGNQTCVMGSSGSTWGACSGEVIPEANDRCDGVDRNCDGNPNTGCGCVRGQTRSCYTGPTGTAGVGLCRAGTQTCASASDGMGTAWSTCQGEVLPATDTCDGMDRNCDGNPNTNCVCTLGASRSCYTGPTGTAGVGICRAGVQSCVRTSSGTGTVWAACTGEQRPNTAEICANNVDDNCNGMVDEGCTTGTGCPNNAPRCGGICCASNEACANNVCVGNGQLRFTLSWDISPADLDLHIVPPCGTEIYYGRLSACGGTLDVDSCPALSRSASYPSGTDPCNGPENVFWQNAPASGSYLICVNPWRMNSGTTARYTLNVYRGTQLVRTFTGTRSASTNYVQCTRNAASFVGEISI